MSFLNSIINAVTGGPPAQAPVVNSHLPVGGQPTGDPELTGKTKKPEKTHGLYEKEFGPVVLNPSIVLAVIRKGKVKGLTKEEQVIYDDVAARWNRIQAAIREVGHDAARDAFKAQRQEQAKLISDGKETSILKTDAWTRKDFEEDFDLKRHALKVERAKVIEPLFPLAASAAERIQAAAFELHAKLEAEEKARCEDFGVMFKPSYILVCVGQLTWRAKDFVRITPTSNPVDIFKIFTN